MRKSLFALLLLICVWQTNATAQWSIQVVCPNQQAGLTVAGYRGSIQWQYTINMNVWINVPGGTNDTLFTRPPVGAWYRAVITDGTCDPVYSDTTYLINSTLAAHAGRDTTVCLGGTGVTIGGSPSATGGDPPYACYWSPGFGLSSTSAFNPVSNPTRPVTYILTVSDSLGCIAHDTIHVDTATCMNFPRPHRQLRAIGREGIQDGIADGSSHTRVEIRQPYAILSERRMS